MPRQIDLCLTFSQLGFILLYMYLIIGLLTATQNISFFHSLNIEHECRLKCSLSSFLQCHQVFWRFFPGWSRTQNRDRKNTQIKQSFKKNAIFLPLLFLSNSLKKAQKWGWTFHRDTRWRSCLWARQTVWGTARPPAPAPAAGACPQVRCCASVPAETPGRLSCE